MFNIAAQYLKARSAKKKAEALDAVLQRMKELTPQIKELEKLKAEYDELRGVLCEVANRDYEDDSDVVFETDGVEVQFSAKDFVRTISSMKKLFNYLGPKVFLTHANFPLKAFDKLVPKEEHHKFISRERVGSRTSKVILLDE